MHSRGAADTLTRVLDESMRFVVHHFVHASTQAIIARPGRESLFVGGVQFHIDPVEWNWN